MGNMVELVQNVGELVEKVDENSAEFRQWVSEVVNDLKPMEASHSGGVLSLFGVGRYFVDLGVSPIGEVLDVSTLLPISFSNVVGAFAYYGEPVCVHTAEDPEIDLEPFTIHEYVRMYDEVTETYGKHPVIDEYVDESQYDGYFNLMRYYVVKIRWFGLFKDAPRMLGDGMYTKYERLWKIAYVASKELGAKPTSVFALIRMDSWDEKCIDYGWYSDEERPKDYEGPINWWSTILLFMETEKGLIIIIDGLNQYESKKYKDYITTTMTYLVPST